MIQFNLLPDIKQEYIKVKRAQRTVLLVSFSVIIISLTVCLLLFLAINVFQKQHLSNLDKDIKNDSKTLSQIPEINKILTVQNQLNSIPGLHQNSPVASKLFKYLSQLTPAQAKIARISINFKDQNIVINGTADNLNTVNKFIDTLKFTDYLSRDGKQGKAFKAVVLANFSPADKKTNFELGLNFEPVIFDAAAEATLTVPNIITTRSLIEKPDPLFESQPKSDNQRP